MRPAASAPVPVATPVDQITFAVVLVQRDCGLSPDRCIWNRGIAGACSEKAVDFYCAEHAALLAQDHDPDVRAAWEWFQHKLAAYRQKYGAPTEKP